MLTNKLLLIKGEPYRITNKVVVNNPTLGEIAKFDEDRYWSLLSQLCATSFDHRLFLEEAGVDYLTIDDWQMFYNSCRALKDEDTQILLPDIEFSKLRPAVVNDSGEVALVDENMEIVINEFVYYELVDFIRKCHGIERNYKIPGNKVARQIYMREAREARERALRNKNKSGESYLEPLISALCNSQGFKYNFDTVWDLPIYTFMDATRRIQKIKSADCLMKGMYGGMLDVSKMNKGQLNKDLNWMGELK